MRIASKNILLAAWLLIPVRWPWWATPASGQEPSPCTAVAELACTPSAAACRIHNALPTGAANVGSGTLIDVTSNGQRGLVLTCAHLFSEGTGRVVVEFPGGATHGALVVAIDHQADLAALEIASPPPTPAEVCLPPPSGGSLRACGFGGSGQYRCLSGAALGCSQRPGQQSVRIAGAVRSGDSGGGVFDDRGRLCAVVWGAADGVTYASTGRPLQQFLSRLLAPSRLGRAESQPVAGAAVCPDGRCPLVGAGGGAPAGRCPAAGGDSQGRSGSGGGLLPWQPLAPARSCDCGQRLAAMADRLDQLERSQASADGASAGLLGALGGVAPAAAPWAAALLGLSGPVGWGVAAAAIAGGWFIGRRWKKKAPGASRKAREQVAQRQLAPHSRRPAQAPEATAAAAETFPGASDSAELLAVHQPVERDDVEARQLLRLSQLEGRDPLQDALAGRLALDRLDALAESDDDPPRQQWADALRRELRERFNDIAPTKFEVHADCGVRIAE